MQVPTFTIKHIKHLKCQVRLCLKAVKYNDDFDMLMAMTTLVCWERVPGPRRVEDTGQRLFWYSVCAGGANTENSTKMI